MPRNLSPAHDEDEDEFPEPPRLKLLRWMVMGLMVTMMLGVVVIAGTVAVRLWAPTPAAQPVEAGALALPEGAEITGLGASPVEILATVRLPDGAEALLTFRRADGELLSQTPIRRD